MADKKISALTSATTPLAGTEVLPIVQSGTTVKVAVSDLTAGRDTAALSLSLNSAPNRDTLNLGFKQMFYNTAGDGNANTVIGQIRSQVRNYGTNIATASFASIQFATDPSSWPKGEIRFLTNGFDGTDTAGTQQMTIGSSGNVTFNTGNLIMGTAGKGTVFGNGAGVSFKGVLNSSTVSTTPVTCSDTASSGGGVVYISGYNASGGNRFVALIGYRDTVVTSIYTANNTGLTINFTATSNVLQVATTSGSIVCSSVSLTV